MHILKISWLTHSWTPPSAQPVTFWDAACCIVGLAATAFSRSVAIVLFFLCTYEFIYFS